MSVTTAILQVLFNAQPVRLNETTLLAEVRLTGGGCGDGAFASALQNLRLAGMASYAEDELTKDRMWQIEPKGVSRIRGAR